jgi:L-lactate dehydrogenase complex protein LldF
MSSPQFDHTIRGALNNNFLQMALTRATSSFKNMRLNAVRDLGYFEELRHLAKAAKDRVVNNLDQYLTQLEYSVTDAGGTVAWAETGQDVVDYIVRLASDKHLHKVVKGKSMTSEEIHLNPALEQAGLEVLETDLGEYIIQLLGERPSHIIGPAIHKTKEEVARLFESRIGLAYTDVPEEMTQAVRQKLRTAFLQADLGITGVNFAVAETGALVLLENEGNIRMSTTLPRIHVAIMGLEKVVANLTDLATLLQILPLSAVGQRLPSYVSLLTGPGRTRGEGPEELHLIIYDGFRSQVLADPLFRQVLRCIRCGACLNFCPVYRLIGGHSYPWVYSGPIGVVLTGAAQGPAAAQDISGASTLCQTCKTVCPVMIDLPELILELRRRANQGHDLVSTAFKTAAAGLSTPLGFDLAGRLMEFSFKTALDASGQARWGPPALKSLVEGRQFPSPAHEPFHRSLFRGNEE